MKHLAYITIGLLTTLSCAKNDACSEILYTTNCIDLSLIDSTTFCTEQWDPVCGCNGITYSNSCFAANNGITSFTTGECCD